MKLVGNDAWIVGVLLVGASCRATQPTPGPATPSSVRGSAAGSTIGANIVAARRSRQQGIPLEPIYPAPCAVLAATKTAVKGTLVANDENQPDTTRIQEAINACPAGQAVKLTRDGEKDAFMSDR